MCILILAVLLKIYRVDVFSHGQRLLLQHSTSFALVM